MILTIENKINGGASADIFRIENRVYKLFLSGTHPENISQRLTRPEDEDRRHKTFLSECGAYEVATEDDFLKQHIPQYYGRCAIDDVQESGRSIGSHYNLRDCYIFEYIDARSPQKWLGIDPGLKHIEKARQAFRAVDIQYTHDACVFLAEDPKRFKVIDFAMREFEVRAV
jgi:hypothetical protein